LTAVTVRVRYAETDQMGIAHHAEYFAWFEVGRTELLREAGLTYRDLEKRGVHFPVIGAEARFLRPAYYDDVLEVRTQVSSLSGARVSFAHENSRNGAGPIATARTEHAAVDARGRPQRLPADVRTRLGARVRKDGVAPRAPRRPDREARRPPRTRAVRKGGATKRAGMHRRSNANVFPDQGT
jgi:acyl-CoA thioester hydrolase